MAIKIKATSPGLYGQYREVGHVFEIKHEDHFSERWMEKIDGEGKAKGKGKVKAEPESEDSESASDADVI